MCYRISCIVDIKEVADYFPDIIFDDQIEMDFTAAIHIRGHDYKEHPIIYKNRQDSRLHLKLMEWGCIPHTVTDEEAFKEVRKKMLNARSERILDDYKSYWHVIRYRRCLVPVTGFYEYKKESGFDHKIPYFIKLKNQEMFFLPALYAAVDLPNKKTGKIEKRWTYVIITRAAVNNTVMREIHNWGEHRWRMPLMLPFEMSKRWVKGALDEQEYRRILNFEMPAEELDHWPVYSLDGVRPDGKAANDPYEWIKQPELF